MVVAFFKWDVKQTSYNYFSRAQVKSNRLGVLLVYTFLPVAMVTKWQCRDGPFCTCTE